MTEPLIDVASLSHRRGDFTLAIEAWQVQPGCVVGLVGPNGAGKTTLLRLLAGFERPTSGRVQVLGLDPVSQLPQVRQQLGHMSDDQAVFNVTVAELLRLVSGYYPAWDAALVDKLLERFGLDPKAHAARLSKGQGTRLRILLALAHRPRVVLLDEPGAGLDLGARKALLRTVLEIVGDGDRSVVVSSHQLADVARIADRLLVLRQGRVLKDGPTEELLGDEETLEERLVAWGAAG